MLVTNSLKSFLLTNIHFPNIMNRQELVEAYIDRILDNMSTKDLIRIVGDQLEENLSSYTDEELITEVEEYYQVAWLMQRGDVQSVPVV